jgi:hypothetical protein
MQGETRITLSLAPCLPVSPLLAYSVLCGFLFFVLLVFFVVQN